MIMTEAYWNLASHNFSGRDVAVRTVRILRRRANWSQEIRYLIIRGYHCLIDKIISDEFVLGI